MIERESNGPHVAPCSCDESLELRRERDELRRRVLGAAKCLNDTTKLVLAAVVDHVDPGALRNALRAYNHGAQLIRRALGGDL